jgi:hypothetical protein
MGAAGSTGMAAAALAGGAAAVAARAGDMPGASYPATAAAALKLLMQGNERWARGRAQRAPGHIQAEVDALRPAYHLAITQPGDLDTGIVQLIA